MIIKKLTEELITEKLEKTGIGEYYIGSEVQVNNIKLHFNFKLTDTWGVMPEFAIYSQTTADGSVVQVAREPNPNRRYNIEEDVHYYDRLLGERLEQFVRESDKNDIHIYIDDLDQHWIEEAMAGLWDDVYEKLREDMEYALEFEGYEYED